VVDPEEDFDGFMDSLPVGARTNILSHMRGELEDESKADLELRELKYELARAQVFGDTEAFAKAMKRLREIAAPDS